MASGIQDTPEGEASAHVSLIDTVCFDFEHKALESIEPAAIADRVGKNQPCWVDVLLRDKQTLIDLLLALNIPEMCIDEVLDNPVSGRHDVYNECLHLTMASMRDEGGELVPGHMDMILGEYFVVTIRREPLEFMDQVRRTYEQDFKDFASTLGFLIYEVWDSLVDSYRALVTRLEDEGDRLQASILGEVEEDQVFADVARVTQNILSFRKVMLAERDVLQELAVRKSRFVPASTQPFLDNMVGRIDRLANDLIVEREVMAETINLHLGIVGHKTNRIINRLTVVSMIFLPLTFLCGIYGMNFNYIPEIQWRYGYVFFWVTVVILATVLVIFTRRKRWL